VSHPVAEVTSHVDTGITRDGLVQLRRFWAADDPWAALLIIHGIGEHGGRYEHVGAAFAAAGIDTVAIDQRGFGETGGRRAHVARFGEYLDDVEDQLREVRRLGLPTVLLGHSMGGLISLSYVLEGRPAPDLLVLSGPALGATIPAPLRMLAPVLGRLLPTLPIKSDIDGEVLASDPLVGEAYLADPLVVKHTTASLGMGLLAQMTWANAHLSRLSVPTLVLHGADDRLVPTASSEPLAFVPGVERHALPGLRHEILNEPVHAEIVNDIVEWIAARLGRSA
jgi:alpha-beta hydrolase superfamily lysophospholipase